MLERDWLDFLKRGHKPIKIAQVPAFCVKHLGAISDKLHLDPMYARKAAGKHGLSPAYFNLIFDGVERGVAIADRANHVSFYYLDPLSNKWFHIAIKCSGDTNELFLATFHRTTDGKFKNRLKKFGVLNK